MAEWFAPRHSKHAASNSTRIKEWISFRLALDHDATVMVTGLRCSEPGCPALETVIAILNDAGNQQYKLHKSKAEVVAADIQVL